ncbi:MAG: glycoside hydrolase family 3 N-terminal domain-containing protein [Cyanobacteria bacterium P01_A01_bin.123]
MGFGTVHPVLPDIEHLSLEAQVAQMIVVRTTGHLFDHEIQYPAWEADDEAMTHCLETLGVGGVILLGGSAAEVGLRSQQFQSQSTIPLLIAADIEEGVGQRFSGATWFPPPMALGQIAQQDLPRAIALAEAMGAATAQEALAIGLNWILAPVMDVNNNPANPVINVRAFSDAPKIVSALGSAFIRGAQRHPVLTAAKHFPGHGDTAIDSHLMLPTLSHDLKRLQTVELPPFEAAIATGVDAVMTAHLNLPALDKALPATLSPPILTGLLRRDLGFDGLIVTDAMIMGAIAEAYGPYEAAVLAVEAGADIVLMPADPEGTIQAIAEAVTIGRLSSARIQASLERIWRAKLKVTSPYSTSLNHSHAWEHTPPPAIQLDQLAQPQVRQTAATILREAQQQRGTIQTVSSHPSSFGRNLIVTDEILDCRFLGRTAPAIALPKQLGYTLHIADCRSPMPVQDALEPIPTLLQLFIRGNPFRGTAHVSQLAQAWLETLLKSNTLQGVVIYGSPYVRDRVLPQLPATVPYCFTYGQMPEAQGIALEKLFQNASGVATVSDRTFTD